MTAVAERMQRDLGFPVGVLITVWAMTAGLALAATAGQTADAVVEHPADALVFLLLALALQMFSVPIYGRGSISVAAIGLLAAGFALGPGPAMTVGFLAALVQFVRRRGLVHRAIFDAANLTLSSGGAAFAYAGVTFVTDATPVRFVGAVVAGSVFYALNVGVLSLAMALTEHTALVGVWRERFHWLTAHYLAFGPLALACTTAFERVGFAGLMAFALPPALLVFSVHQYLERTRAAVEEARRTNDHLQVANRELGARNDDLHELFEFAGGLAARAADEAALVAYAETAVARLAGSGVRIHVGPEEVGEIALVAGMRRVGTLVLDAPPADAARWERLRDTVLPQLATALESAHLVAHVRRTHLATIAALSRSMEAKDYYTGGHTERVAAIAVALARRLGVTGADLEAIEIGALLHDIGKIGIPEHILHKPGPLTEDEWAVMKQHPVISDYILSEVDLPAIVRQIARSSHERMDGAGYPDRLAGELIPLVARIVLVADAFDALTTDRPYRRARHTLAALEEVRANAGTQFCPEVVDALHRLFREEPQALAGDLAGLAA
jgi:putative nucleotidyltransferase with HDIG domain